MSDSLLNQLQQRAASHEAVDKIHQDLDQARQLLVQARGTLLHSVKLWSRNPEKESEQARVVERLEEYLEHELLYQQKLEALMEDLERRLPSP